ncbi:MAG: hypothetical protein K5917_07695 [Clostridiales bacterium]|nr:hypothetical protein [Clostridiales bacterium]
MGRKKEGSEHFFKLLLKDTETNKLAYRIRVPLNVYCYLDKKYTRETEFTGFISIVAEFDSKYNKNSKNYKQTLLIHSKYLLIEKGSIF